MKCWDIIDKKQTQLLKFDEPVKSISCGYRHVCALNVRGDIQCAGGGGSKRYQEELISSEMKHDVSKIKAGRFYTCVIKKDLRILCNGRKLDNAIVE